MTWNLSGLAYIQLIMKHAIKTEFSFSSIKLIFQRCHQHKQGVVVSIIIQRNMFNQIKDVIYKRRKKEENI